RGVSFVSVTQQFNTTTSMGRLTLNVLLSFAQFEREVAGERIRDKIAASKKKGIWMGGVPPIGYQVRDRKLVIVPAEADRVRHIFRRYCVVGSVRLIKEELDAQGIVSKQWTSTSGHSRGGKPIARGALYLMLQNRIYCGEIVHKDQHYLGEHDAIIDPQLWQAVQEKLVANTVERSTGGRARSPSLLAGLLFDGEGNRMTPTHAVKNGTRYRYYISHPLMTQTRAGSPAGLRVPATEIERLVANRIRQFLAEPDSIFKATEQQGWEAVDQQRLIDGGNRISSSWSTLSPIQIRTLLTTLICRIDLCRDRVDVHIRTERLATVLGTDPPVSGDPNLIITLSVPAQLRRAGKQIMMRIEGADAFLASPSPSLIKLIVR